MKRDVEDKPIKRACRVGIEIMRKNACNREPASVHIIGLKYMRQLCLCAGQTPEAFTFYECVI